MLWIGFNCLGNTNWQFNFVFTRFYFFLFGIYLGKLSFEGEYINVSNVILVSVSVLGLLLANYLHVLSDRNAFIHHTTIFVLPFYLSFILMINLIVIITTKNIMVKTLLEWLGDRSYEIYLATAINTLRPTIFFLLGVEYCNHFKTLLLSSNYGYIVTALLIYGFLSPALILLTAQVLHVINHMISKYTLSLQ